MFVGFVDLTSWYFMLFAAGLLVILFAIRYATWWIYCW